MNIRFGFVETESYRSWRTLWRRRYRQTEECLTLPSEAGSEWQSFYVNFMVLDGVLLIDNCHLEYARMGTTG